MVAHRPGAGRQKERTFLQATQMPCRGSSYFSTIYFSLRWSERARKEVFRFLRSSRCFGVTGTAAAACPGGGARKREKSASPSPSSIGCTSRSLSLRGNTAEESLSGIKYNPGRRDVKVKHQPDGPHSLIMQPIPAWPR